NDVRKLWMILILISVVLAIGTSCQKKDSAPDEDNETGNAENAVNTSALEGFWDGSIKIPNQPLHIIVSFQDHDTLSGDISIPIQGVDEHPFSSIEKDDGSIVFTMEIGGQSMTFNGEASDDKIEGTFTQAGQTFPFELDKKRSEEHTSEL